MLLKIKKWSLRDWEYLHALIDLQASGVLHLPIYLSCSYNHIWSRSDRLRIPTRTFCKQLAAPGWIAYILAPTTIVDLGSIENTYMHLSICKRLGAPRWFAYPSCSLDHSWSWIILISTRYVAYPKDGSMIGLSLCEYDGSHEF